MRRKQGDQARDGVSPAVEMDRIASYAVAMAATCRKSSGGQGERRLAPGEVEERWQYPLRPFLLKGAM